MEKEREKQVYLARLAEQAERYDGIGVIFFSCVYMVATVCVCVQIFWSFFLLEFLVCFGVFFKKKIILLKD